MSQLRVVLLEDTTILVDGSAESNLPSAELALSRVLFFSPALDGQVSNLNRVVHLDSHVSKGRFSIQLQELLERTVGHGVSREGGSGGGRGNPRN